MLVYFPSSKTAPHEEATTSTGSAMSPRTPQPTDVGRFLPMRALDFSILVALAEEELYGYAIVKRIAEGDAGAVRLAPGNLYTVLDRLIGDGLIEGVDRVDPEDERRRYYGITAQGRRVAAAEAARLRAVVRTADRLGLAAERSR
jgi:DNA-binding PadR family transcriptional regulator